MNFPIGPVLILAFLLAIALFFWQLSRYLAPCSDLRIRVAIPALVAVLFAGLGHLLGDNPSGSSTTVALAFLFLLPGLAFVTLYPFVEPFFAEKRPVFDIMVASAVLTLVYGTYLIFTIGMAELAPPKRMFLFFTDLFPYFWGYLAQYLEICAVLAVLMGAVLLACSVHEKGTIRVVHPVAAIFLLLFAYFVADILFAGFLAVFFAIMLSRIPRPSVRMAASLLCGVTIAGIDASVLSRTGIVAALQYYDPSLLSLVLLASGAVTLLPLIDRYLDVDDFIRTPIVFLAASATVALLSLLSGAPAGILRGLSSITAGGAHAAGETFETLFHAQIFLFLAAALIAGILYGALVLLTRIAGHRKTPPSPVADG